MLFLGLLWNRPSGPFAASPACSMTFIQFPWVPQLDVVHDQGRRMQFTLLCMQIGQHVVDVHAEWRQPRKGRTIVLRAGLLQETKLS